MNRDGLKRIYLINSADYQYADIDLTQNTLLLGDSGVGKTTLMRAVLFFYTMDTADSLLNINRETKKSFVEWYFKYNNSHIVYEYTKGESRTLFIVSSVGKLHYSFVDFSNATMSVKELLVENNTPVSFEKLQENIQKNALINYVTTRKDKYIMTFHKRDEDGKKIKQESSCDFTLFEDIASRKEFAKTLSNIFANSKVNAESLKKSIVALIEDSHASINLKEIHKNLKEFVEHKSQIEHFEKKFPYIEKLAHRLSEYRESRKDFKVKANELHTLEVESLLQIEKKESELKEIKTQKSILEDDFSREKTISEAKIKEIEKEVILLQNKIEGLQKKERDYEEKNITHLVQEYEKLEHYKSRVEDLRKKYIALTKDSDNITNEYKQILEKLKAQKNEAIVALKNGVVEKKNSLNNQKMKVIESREKRVVEATKSLEIEKSDLTKELGVLKELFNQTKIEQAKVQNHPFNLENIEKYKDEVRVYETELAKLKNERLNSSVAIKEIEREIEGITSKLKADKQAVAQESKKQKDLLFVQKEELEKKLDYDAGNLYAYLSQKQVKNRQEILTFVKDEILFSDVAFSAREVDASSSAIFGLEVNFHEKLENSYDQARLEKELKFVKNELKECSKSERVKSETLERNASKINREKERERSQLYRDGAKLEEKELSYKRSLQLTQSNLDDALSEAKEQKAQKTQELNRIYAEQEMSQEKMYLQIKEIEGTIFKLREKIVLESSEQISQIESSLKEVDVALKQEITLKEKEYEKEVQKTEQELQQILAKNGVDEELLKAITDEGKALGSRVSTIERNIHIVVPYLENEQEAIAQIPELINELEFKQQELKNEEISLEKVVKEHQKSVENIIAQIKRVEGVKSLLEKFNKDYALKITSQDIAKAIKSSLSTSYKEDVTKLVEDEVYMSEVITNITTLFSSIESLKSKIQSETMEILRVLKSDNIFKIETINDNMGIVNFDTYMKIAQELVEYKERDKIELLKETSSEIFKSSFHSIRKELNLFEDAVLDIKAEVSKLRNSVRKAVDSFNVIDAIKIQAQDENNEILRALKELLAFYSDNSEKFLSGLFDGSISAQETLKSKEDLSSKISDLVKLLVNAKEYLNLESSFVLEFKVIEKGNDLGWRQTLNDIGSNGTSTLIKSIINISMLQMVSKSIFKNAQMQSHCILDEIGMISTDYFKELKDFVNESGFLFLNGMPTEDDILISMYPTVYVGEDCGDYSRMLLASKVVEA